MGKPDRRTTLRATRLNVLGGLAAVIIGALLTAWLGNCGNDPSHERDRQRAVAASVARRVVADLTRSERALRSSQDGGAVVDDPLFAKNLVFGLSDRHRDILAAVLTENELATFDLAATATLRAVRWLGQPVSVVETGQGKSVTTSVTPVDPASWADIEHSTVARLHAAEEAARMAM